MAADRRLLRPGRETRAPQEPVRRLAGGSIDYRYYDARARSCRGAAFRQALRRLAGLVRRAIGRGRRPGATTGPSGPLRAGDAREIVRPDPPSDAGPDAYSNAA